MGKKCVYRYVRTSSTAHTASYPMDEAPGERCRVQKCLDLYFHSTIRLLGLNITLHLLHNTSVVTRYDWSIFRAPQYLKKYKKDTLRIGHLKCYGSEYGDAFIWEVLPPSTRQYIRWKQHVHPSVVTIYKATMRHISSETNIKT